MVLDPSVLAAFRAALGCSGPPSVPLWRRFTFPSGTAVKLRDVSVGAELRHTDPDSQGEQDNYRPPPYPTPSSTVKRQHGQRSKSLQDRHQASQLHIDLRERLAAKGRTAPLRATSTKKGLASLLKKWYRQEYRYSFHSR